MGQKVMDGSIFALLAAYSVALVIGIGVVGWCANTIVRHSERISKLETRKCPCDGQH